MLHSCYYMADLKQIQGLLVHLIMRIYYRQSVELTVNEELLAGDELVDMLNKYNISFEDYIPVVGSGSEAGKTLQKLSQIKRMRPAAMIAIQEAATRSCWNYT